MADESWCCFRKKDVVEKGLCLGLGSQVTKHMHALLESSQLAFYLLPTCG